MTARLTLEQRLTLIAAEQELDKRSQYESVDVLQECLPYQLAFIKDPNKRKVVCSTRRSGKSFCLALYLISEALKTPKGKFIYLALTNESAKRTMWSDIFESIILKYELNVDLNSRLEIVFPNGAIIYLAGLDATPKQMTKLRGQKYSLAVIDECQDFSQDLSQIIKSVLKMALAQTAATLCLAGTPGNAQGTHYWWLVNKPETQETEWSKFFFDWRNNTKVDPISLRRICDVIQEQCDNDIARNPLIVNTPEWKQEIDGQWDISTSARIYRFEPIANGLPCNISYSLPSQQFLETASYGLGLDLGFNPDPNAFTITAYNLRFDNRYHVIKSYEQGNITTQEIAANIQRLDQQYHFTYMVADGGAQGAQIVYDLQTTYGIPIVAADKYGKLAHQNMMNSDFITQQIVIYQPDNIELIKQLQNVIWDRKGLLDGKFIEDSKFPNHLTDSLLYNHHHSRHNWYKAPKPPPQLPTNQSMYNDTVKQLILRHKAAFSGIDFGLPNDN